MLKGSSDAQCIYLIEDHKYFNDNKCQGLIVIIIAFRNDDIDLQLDKIFIFINFYFYK